MSTIDIERLHFYQRQALGALDLEAQQAYHRDMRRRHNLGPHTWGIVTGLELEEIPAPQGSTTPPEVWIRPGLAVDGFGREFVVLEPYRLDPSLFKNEANDYVPVYLTYNEEAAASPASGYELCDTPDQFGRVRESFRVVVGQQLSFHENITVAGKVATASETEPPAQASGSSIEITVPPDESAPYQQFPDDQLDREARWLVRLGSVNWDGSQFETNDATRLREERDYAGLVGERILAPTNQLLIRRRWEDDALMQAIVENPHTQGNVGAQMIVREDETHACVLAFFGSTESVYRDLQPKTGFVAALKDAAQLAFNHQGDGPITFHTDDWNERMRITKEGNVGVGTKSPSARLEVQRDWDGEDGALRLSGDKPTIRFAGGANAGNESWILHLGSDGPGNMEFFRRTGAQAWERVFGLQPGYAGVYQRKLYLSGGSDGGGQSISFNAHRSADNSTWVFPDPSRTAATVEMDDWTGKGRFEVWGTTTSDRTGWIQRLRVDLESGDVYIAHSGGNVGIGTSTPDKKLRVEGDARITGSLRVDGGLYVAGSENLIVVETKTFAVKNAGENTPGSWSWDYSALFDVVYDAFAVLQGFSIWDYAGDTQFMPSAGTHAATTDAIVQHAFVRVDSVSNVQVSGVCYASESLVGNEVDNTVLFTVVAIGRR